MREETSRSRDRDTLRFELSMKITAISSPGPVGSLKKDNLESKEQLRFLLGMCLATDFSSVSIEIPLTGIGLAACLKTPTGYWIR